MVSDGEKHKSNAKYYLDLYNKEMKLVEESDAKAIEETYKIHEKYWDDLGRVLEEKDAAEETKECYYDIYKKYKEKNLQIRDVKAFVVIHKDYGRYIKYNMGFLDRLNLFVNGA